VQIRDDEEALELVLKPHPVLDAADPMPEVQTARWSVTRQDPATLLAHTRFLHPRR
jgi:hypothetical protein